MKSSAATTAMTRIKRDPEKIRKHDAMMKGIAACYGGTFPSVDDIGFPGGVQFAKIAKQLVKDAVLYSELRSIKHSPSQLRSVPSESPKNALLASHLIFTLLTDRLLKGDETARISFALLAHLSVQLNPAIAVASSMLKSGGAIKDGNVLDWYSRTVKIIDRVNELLRSGKSKAKAYAQVATEMGKPMTGKKIRRAFEGSTRL